MVGRGFRIIVVSCFWGSGWNGAQAKSFIGVPGLAGSRLWPVIVGLADLQVCPKAIEE